jgi:two-component system, NarL family, sensor histidine kinase UhpB
VSLKTRSASPEESAGHVRRPAQTQASSAMKSSNGRERVTKVISRLRPVPVSILSRVFTVNAIVFGLAVFVLIVSPATVSNPISLTELAVLVVGLLMTLAIDLLLLAVVLSPLRSLATLMDNIDPMRPGQRAPLSDWASTEVISLARAFNTMLDRVETERRESARRALAAQEAERLRIARELHDEVGQTLTAVALQAERAISDRAYQTQALTEITQTVRHSLDDVRRIAHELRPEALDDLGLTDALISLCLRIERQGAMKVLRELEGALPPLTSETELVIYRVAQEALTNALRHSAASQVRVALRHDQDGVLLSVADDGHGLPENLGEANGLAGMRERAIFIQADFEITSPAQGGVDVRLEIPTAVNDS